MLVKCLDGTSGGVLWGVQKCDISFENEIMLVILGAGLLPRQLFRRHRQDPESIIAEALVLSLQSDDQVGVHRRHFSIQLKVGALVKDLFRSTFGEENCFAFGSFHQN